MANKKAPVKKPGGPFLAAAVLCENIVKDSSGMTSIVRMLDTLTIQIHPQLEIPPEVPVTVNLFLSFRTGSARGKHKLKVILESPGGERKEVTTDTMYFGKEPQSGANVEAKISMGVKKAGVLWFDVLVDGKLVTRVPLSVVIIKPAMPPHLPAGAIPPVVKRSKRT